MRVLGITAEYNPFHNGHRYHIEKSKEALKPDYTIAVISGDFTQRGAPAILDKWQRSRLAVENGIDAVFELPFIFACNRAEIFARGSVGLLSSLGATDISFGSESGELEELLAAAKGIMAKSAEIEDMRSRLMKEGSSFASGNEAAVKQILGEDAAGLIREPNNILALEYLKNIISGGRTGTGDIKPFTVKRKGSGYHGYDGASSIRKMVTDGSRAYEGLVPENVSNALAAMTEAPCEGADGGHKPDDIAYGIIRSEIIKKTPHELAEIYCMGEGLENKLKKEAISCGNLTQLMDAMVSRRYTRAAVRRLMTYILIGVRDHEPEEISYGRILAANGRGREFLNRAKKQLADDFSLVTNVNRVDAMDRWLKLDILASDMYNIICGRDLYDFSDKVMKPFMC